ncbi:DEAHC-like protein [Mya arenaria]|uniref:RBR-type E3 ubiquitin transferase n=1 Tax=Mya arenaria TaxID=6604 RepID=A0ABY7G7I9_MYAAR|nr:DEAHC-like protein [Mya arenaria]
MLSVYREWDKVNEKEKGKWCNTKSVNGKSMKGVREMVDEICTSLKRELDVNIRHNFIEVAEADSRIGKLIFECMYSNLGYYLGHESAGYLIVNRNHRVQIHPSSALISLGCQPEWIVFNRVLKTSADFITEITPVPEDYIKEAERLGKIKLDRTALHNQRIERVSTIPVGKHVFWKFVGPMHKERKSLEADIQDVCNGSNVIIEANRRRGEVVLFTVPQYSKLALDILKKNLKPLPSQLLNERIEKPLCESEVRVVIKEGGEVADILMPDQYRVCNIKKNDSAENSLTEDEVHTVLSQFGPLEQIWQTTENRSTNSMFWGKVTFTNASDANEAVSGIRYEEDSLFSLVPSTFTKNRHIRQQGFTMKLSWTRRKPEDVVRLLMTRIQVLDGDISVQPAKERLDDKKSDLFIRGIPLTVCEDDIKEGLANSLGVVNSKERFTVFIPRENCTLRTNELGLVRTELTNLLSTLSRPEHFRSNVVEYRQQTVTAFAFVTFNNAEMCEHVADRINDGGCYINDCKLRAEVEYKSSVHVKRFLFDLLKQDINEKVEMYRTQSQSTTVEIRSLISGNFSLDIQSISSQNLARAKVSFDKLVQGEVLDCDVINNIQVLFFGDGLAKIKEIEKFSGAVIILDERRMQISVQGSTASKKTAIALIRTEVLRCADSKETIVRLKGEDNPPGLMKALVVKYGIKLDELKTKTGLSSITLNFRYHEISLSGKDGAVVKAISIIGELKESLSRDKTAANASTDLPDCPVCLTPINEEDMFRLEYCGHAYCETCLTNQIRFAIQNKEFPVSCAVQNCDKGFVARDFNFQMGNNFIMPSELVQASMTSFVRRHNKEYKFCPTPNCNMVYKVSGIGGRFDCVLCKSSTCTKCHIEFHEGLTCAMYISAKNDEDSVRRWINEDPQNRKSCPVCNISIEKIDGCYHITCKCGSHVCWKCLKYFSSMSACYGHMQAEHDSFV